MKSSKKTLSDSSAILILSTAVVKIISALFKVPLATDTFLGDVGFGYYSVAHDLYTPFYLLAISGLPVAVSQITAECIAKNQYAKIKNNFSFLTKFFSIVGIIASVFLFFVSLPIVAFSNDSSNILYCVIAVVPSIFCCFLISVYRGFFEGFSNMVPTAVSKVIEALIKLIFGLIVSYIIIRKTGNPAFAAAGAMLTVSFGTLIATLYLFIKFKISNPLKDSEIDAHHDTSNFEIKSILIIAIPFALASLTSSLVNLADVFSVKLCIDGADSDYLNTVFLQNPEIVGDVSTFLYGVRSKALTLHNLIPTFTVSLAVAAIPVLTGFTAKNDKKSLQQNTSYSLKLISLIAFPASLGMIALSGPIMSLLYSTETILGRNMLILYGVGALFGGLCVPLMTLLQSMNFHIKTIVNVLVAFGLKILSALLLVSVPEINIYAAPISTLLCYLYLTVALLIILKQNIKNIGFFTNILKPIFAAFLCALTAYGISLLHDSKIVTIVAIFVAMVVYFAVIILTKTFSKEEISELKSLKMK